MGRLARFIHFYTEDSPSELPKEYRKIGGFSTDDNCYWTITNLRLSGSDTIRFSFSVNAACNVLGCYTTTSAQTNYSLYVGNASSAKYLRYNGGTYGSWAVADKRYNVTITPTGSKGMEEDSTWTQKEFNTVADFCICTTSIGVTSAKLKGSLYGNIVVDGKAKLIPCERKSDGALGYYDTYTKTFHVPATGTPTPIY